MSSESNVAVKPISEKMRRRIEAGLHNLRDPDSDTRKRYEAAGKKWDEVFKPLQDAIAKSECLTETDFGIVINV